MLMSKQLKFDCVCEKAPINSSGLFIEISNDKAYLEKDLFISLLLISIFFMLFSSYRSFIHSLLAFEDFKDFSYDFFSSI
jgi:hypothetical protein